MTPLHPHRPTDDVLWAAICVLILTLYLLYTEAIP